MTTVVSDEITDDLQDDLQLIIGDMAPHLVDDALQTLLIHGKPYAVAWAIDEIEARKAERADALQAALSAHIVP
jgi:hypothetical protein